jgi:Cytochrome c554 and c-prime
MTLTKSLLLLLVVCSLALIGGCSDDDPAEPVNPPALAFAGSDVCGTCHTDEHDQWSHSGHPYKLTAITGNTAPTAGFPDPSAFSDAPASPPEGKSWSDFSYTIGGFGWKMRWIQNDGYIYTPDVGLNQWNFENSQFSDYHKGEEVAYNCGACHTTGWVDSDDGVATNNQDGMVGFLGTMFAGGVHCEKCHGMGSQHVFQPKTYKMEKDDSSAFCGKCHTRGGDNGVTPGGEIIEASFNADTGARFIKHHEQYDEWYNSAHNSTFGPGCNDCHNPHASVKFDATTPGEGVSLDVNCVSCHVTGDHADIASTTHGHGATCTDCHMPDASKSAIANNIHDGDISTHLWKINTSINGKVDMFSAEGTSVALDGDGHGAITLDFACYGCHKDADGVGGPNSIKTMQQLVDKAATMHTYVPAKIANN